MKSFRAILILILLMNTTISMAKSTNDKFANTQYIDGLYYQKSKPFEEAKGVVILTHGVLEHSGRYRHFERKLNKSGYIVYSYDLRGHGRSNGIKAHISNFNSYIKDLNTIINMVQKKEKGKSFFLFGHSMGGLITLIRAFDHENDENLKGIILSAPAINLPIDTLRNVKLALGKKLRKIFPLMDAMEDINISKLTDDYEMQRKHILDGLIEDDFTISLGVEINNAAKKARNMIMSNKQLPPVFFIQGENDEIIDAKANIKSAKDLTSEDFILSIEGGLHESLNARPLRRNMTMNEIINFMNLVNE